MNDVLSIGHSSQVARVRRKRLVRTFLGVVGFEPRIPSLEHTCLPTRVQSNAANVDGYRCINSILLNVLTKGQGGAILPVEDTNLEELGKIGDGTNKE